MIDEAGRKTGHATERNKRRLALGLLLENLAVGRPKKTIAPPSGNSEDPIRLGVTCVKYDIKHHRSVAAIVHQL